MVKGDNEYWGRWNQFQETGKFPKRNRNTSFQLPHAELDKKLEGKDIGQDEHGGDFPVLAVNPSTNSREVLRPQVKCDHCPAKFHTPNRLGNHLIATHPDNLDLPGKEDGMIF